MTETAFDTHTFKSDFSTAEARWAAVGPYYAMFPQRFAFEKIVAFTRPGGRVLDPFAGRGTSIYYAAALGRTGLGIEINPVGWLYGHVKLSPAPQHKVESRLTELSLLAESYRAESEKMSEFFRLCFADTVRPFLLAARHHLDWKHSATDATLMALILVNLHGNAGQALSNQMRQTKAMAPDYSVRWWKERRLLPPAVDPKTYLLQRIRWRYVKGTPHGAQSGSRILHGNSLERLPQEARKVKQGKTLPFDMLLTSPPYHDITNYQYDQWLRYWMLGGPDTAVSRATELSSRYAPKQSYRDLLMKVFSSVAEMMTKDAVIYVRTDAREFTRDTTRHILKTCFPKKKETMYLSVKSRTQTALFGDSSVKPGEVDFILT